MLPPFQTSLFGFETTGIPSPDLALSRVPSPDAPSNMVAPPGVALTRAPQSPNISTSSEKIKGPLNSHLLFKEWRKVFEEHDRLGDGKAIARRDAERWHGATQEFRDAFVALARLVANEHRVKYPGWQRGRGRNNQKKQMETTGTESSKAKGKRGAQAQVGRPRAHPYTQWADKNSKTVALERDASLAYNRDDPQHHIEYRSKYLQENPSFARRIMALAYLCPQRAASEPVNDPSGFNHTGNGAISFSHLSEDSAMYASHSFDGTNTMYTNGAVGTRSDSYHGNVSGADPSQLTTESMYEAWRGPSTYMGLNGGEEEINTRTLYEPPSGSSISQYNGEKSFTAQEEQWPGSFHQFEATSSHPNGQSMYGAQEGRSTDLEYHVGEGDIAPTVYEPSSGFVYQQFNEDDASTGVAEQGPSDYRQVDSMRIGTLSYQSENGFDYSNLNRDFNSTTGAAPWSRVEDSTTGTFLPPFDTPAGAASWNHVEDSVTGTFFSPNTPSFY